MNSVEMYKVPKLPLPFDLESKRVLKKLAQAHRALAELKGITQIIPNQSILINTLSLQEMLINDDSQIVPDFDSDYTKPNNHIVSD